MPARTFPNDFFPDFAAAADVGGVGDVQREAAGSQAGVMTRNAVAIESRAVSGRTVFSFRVLTGRRNPGCGSRRTKHNNSRS